MPDWGTPNDFQPRRSTTAAEYAEIVRGLKRERDEAKARAEHAEAQRDEYRAVLSYAERWLPRLDDPWVADVLIRIKAALSGEEK